MTKKTAIPVKFNENYARLMVFEVIFATLIVLRRRQKTGMKISIQSLFFSNFHFAFNNNREIIQFAQTMPPQPLPTCPSKMFSPLSSLFSTDR